MTRPSAGEQVLESQAELAELCAAAYIRGRFGTAWLQPELGGRLFVAGGAVRALLEVFIEGGRWEPKDLDVFALDEDAALRAIRACRAAGGTVREDGELVWRLLSPGCCEPIDLVLYDLGENADVPTALATFDFNVNSVGWDGSRLLFPAGRRGEILDDIGARRARVSAGHVFLRRPLRAVRRLNAMVERGYHIPEAELRRYLSNFVRPTGDPGVRNLSERSAT